MKTNEKLRGSWKDNSVERSFCDICKGKNYHPDNSARQAKVRTAMKTSGWEKEFPNACVGSMSGSCLCQYAK